MTARKQDDGYFGWCPHCQNTDGCLTTDPNLDHWYFCDIHKTRWCIGSNLFTAPPEHERRKRYHAKDFGSYEVVDPDFPQKETLQ